MPTAPRPLPRPTPVPALRVLLRGVRCRCPACGEGRVFVRGVRSAQACDACGWRIERCVGHWVGGNEVNVVVTFTAGVAAWLLCLPALGLGVASTAVATAFTGAFAVAFYRPSRGIFFALDYLLDPSPDASPATPPPGGSGPGPGPGRDPRTDPSPGPSPPRHVAVLVPRVSSEALRPASPAPYVPPATVSR